VAPHPDDEVVGAGPLSISLLFAGHEVHVLLVSLGRPGDETRRRAEAEAAAEVGGWALHVPAVPVAIGRDADGASAERAVGALVLDLVDAVGADVVLGPGPHDAHHGHELVGRAVRDGCVAVDGLRWWAWQVWGHLPVVDLVLPYGEAVQARALDALARHRGEVARNDYADLLVGAGRLGAALGAERLLGFGAARPWHEPFATVLCEVVAGEGRWSHHRPRILDPTDPLAGTIDPDRPADWLQAPSPYA